MTPFWTGWPGLKRPEKQADGTFRCPACGNSKPERFMTAAPEGSDFEGQGICLTCNLKLLQKMRNDELNDAREKATQ